MKKGGVGGLAMLLAGYCVLSYAWSFPHISKCLDAQCCFMQWGTQIWRESRLLTAVYFFFFREGSLEEAPLKPRDDSWTA